MTSFSDLEIDEMIEGVPVTHFSKGEQFLRQGDKPSDSYYVIKGCVRQLAYDENGKEVTLNFFTEEEDINLLSFSDESGFSRYALECLEETTLVVCSDSHGGEAESPDIENMKRIFFEKQFVTMQNSFTDFKLQKPAERFEAIMKSRPDLVDRVPQNIMASYLAITPETFSRFKKKFKSS
ncbi:MAG: Crp/Fnr family transcriptional regulator [Acidaminobacteraceae bacterium]